MFSISSVILVESFVANVLKLITNHLLKSCKVNLVKDNYRIMSVVSFLSCFFDDRYLVKNYCLRA